MNGAHLEVLKMIHLRGLRAGKVDVFRQQVTTIGRAAGSDLYFDALSERSVSGHHAVIRQHAGDFELLDADSTNGTFVNGKQVTRTLLNDGDTVRFGWHGPEVRVAIPSQVLARTTVDRVAADLYRPPGDPAPSPSMDESPSARLRRAPRVRFMANTMVAAVSVTAAMTAFVWTLIEGAGLEPAALWFKSYLVLAVAGLLVTLVFALYHGNPGRQRIRAGEVAWVSSIAAAAVVSVIWLWRGGG